MGVGGVRGTPELRIQTATIKMDRTMSSEAELALTSGSPSVPAHLVGRAIPWLHRIWPVAGLAAAGVITVAWICFLGYEFFKLIVPLFL